MAPRTRMTARGLTLIELILVMGLLASVFALAAPSLSRFVSGRSLAEESRRVLAATRHARSQAVSRATPTEVWFEVEGGKVGVAPRAGFESDDDDRPFEFTLTDGVRLEIEADRIDKDGRATIRYRPDGALDVESLEGLRLVDDDGAIDIRRAEVGPGYVIAPKEETP